MDNVFLFICVYCCLVLVNDWDVKVIGFLLLLDMMCERIVLMLVGEVLYVSLIGNVGL